MRFTIVAFLIFVSGVAYSAEVGEVLKLQLDVSRAPQHVAVVASATNQIDERFEFCGQWGFEIEYVLNSEGEAKLAELRAAEEQERKEAEAAGNSYFSRCGPRFSPAVFDLSRFMGGTHWVSLGPGEAYRDTIDFEFNFEWYRDWPGDLVVRYRLDLCEDLESPAASIPPNGLGGSLVAEIPAQ